MKRITYLLSALILAFTAIACTEKEPVWVAPAKTMSIAQANLVFGPVGGDSSFTVTAENAFTASADRDWCTVSVSGSQVSVSVTGNSSNETRYARITLASGEEKLGITVHQQGLVVKGFSISDKSLGSKAQLLEYHYSTNGIIVVNSADSWIRVEQTDEIIRINVDANEGASRTGTVNYSIGDIKGSFSISQSSPFRPYAGWTLSYGGKEYYQDKMLENFAVKADPSSDAETYVIAVIPVDEAASSNLEMDDYVEQVIYPGIIKYLNEIVDYYAGTYKIEDLLLKGSDHISELSSDFPAGSYRLFAVGIDKNGAGTGKYATAEVSTKGPAFDWWLGKWKATDKNGKVSTLTFAVNENGKSYTVTGLYGYDFPLLVNFNADGTVTFTGSSTRSLLSEPYTTGEYVFSSLNMLGLYTSGSSSYYRTGESIDIALGSVSGENTARVSGYWTLSSETWLQYLQMVYRGKASKSGAAEANTVLARNYLPLILEKQ